MSKQQKNNYSSEFKVSSVKLALESDQPIAQTARDLGIKDSTLYTWINNQSNSKEVNNIIKTSECHFEEVARLKKELAMVKQERDLLKKATAYFAKESH